MLFYKYVNIADADADAWGFPVNGFQGHVITLIRETILIYLKLRSSRVQFFTHV